MKNFIEIAAEAAEQLTKTYFDKPETEFIVWLNIALQREAMVSVAYDTKFVNQQLLNWQKKLSIPNESIKAVRNTLVSVWAQESAHQSYFRAMLNGISVPEKLSDRLTQKMNEIRGQVEGWVVANMMSQRLTSRYLALLAVAVGRSVGEVPEFVATLQATSFSEYCDINADLENTAVTGYERMLELGNGMPDFELVEDTTILIDLERTCMDERYHEELFRRLGDWPPPLPPGGNTPVHSPMGPAPTPSDAMTLADARRIIAQAKAFAYGNRAAAFGDTEVNVDEALIYNDPLIQHLREFAAREAEIQETPKLFFTAGA
jgi:hypothetical protein